MKIDRLVTTTLIVTGVLVSVAPANAPMGSPTAYLGVGSWGVGAEYGYGQMDLEASGTVTDEVANSLGNTYLWDQDFRADRIKSNMIFGTLAYGLTDSWDIFVRLGANNARGDIRALPPENHTSETEGGFDGRFGFAAGAGTRVTFYQAQPWALGGLIQGTWFHTSMSSFRIMDPYFPEDETWVGEAKLEYWQIQASVAAALQLDKWRLWAGPFVQYTQGNLDFDGRATIASLSGVLKWHSDIDDSFQVGGHFGANWAISDQFNLWLEGQVTSDTWMVGVGAMIHPEKPFGI
jgi:hypothetical protein